MANKSFRKSQLIAFDNVAAGHDGVLSDPSGSMIIKPCKQSEIDFYESTASHPSILPFIPIYMGRVILGMDAAHAAGALILPGETTPDRPVQASTATLPVVEHAWAPSNGGKIDTDHAVVLENLTAGYRKPNIMDVKLGARLWADDAPTEKRLRLDNASAETTSKSLGYRIAGMKTYQGHLSATSDHQSLPKSDYRIFDKSYGRSFNEESIASGFEEFFLLKSKKRPPYAIEQVIKGFVQDLEQMAEAIRNEESRMYSASLLFVYEGDPQALQDAITQEFKILDSYQQRSTRPEDFADTDTTHAGAASKIRTDSQESDDEDAGACPAVQIIKLIDFAHAQWTPGQGCDENILHGIDNVITILRQILRTGS